MIQRFVERTSVTTALSASRPERRQMTSSSRMLDAATGGAQMTTSAAPSTASAIVRATWSTAPASSAARGPSELGVQAAISTPPGSSGPAPEGSSRSALAIDPPIRPRPRSATRTVRSAKRGDRVERANHSADPALKVAKIHRLIRCVGVVVWRREAEQHHGERELALEERRNRN